MTPLIYKCGSACSLILSLLNEHPPRYIHPQSLITRAYFERLLCMECISRPDGRTKSCLRVQLGDGREFDRNHHSWASASSKEISLPDNESDDVVIYGQLIDDVQSSCSVGLPKLRIRVARILPPPPKGRAAPRPDDPLPRSEYISYGVIRCDFE